MLSNQLMGEMMELSAQHHTVIAMAFGSNKQDTKILVIQLILNSYQVLILIIQKESF